MLSPSDQKPVVVREVWASNLEEEFAIIKDILPCYCHVAIDTEFPGCIYKATCHYSKITPAQTYAIMKKNVDALNIIQLGLTLSNYAGILPDLGTDCCFIWEFNFMEFDVENDSHDPEAIRLLQRQGIDFAKNKVDGISSDDFRRLFFTSGLIFNRLHVTWVTFHGSYDFGYLIKILIGRELPQDIASFGFLMSNFLGGDVYDLKHMMKFYNGLHGGLERLAKTLGVDRVAGKCHQAGSDSLLTMQTYFKFRDVYVAENFDLERETMVAAMSKGVIYGLETIGRRCPKTYSRCMIYSPLATFDNMAV